MDLSVKVYEATSSFPDEEKYGLSSQIRRAVVSISSNIAEGSSRSSEKEFSRFLEIAQGSSFELKTQVLIYMKLGFIDRGLGGNLILDIENISKQISGLRNTLK